MTTSRAILSGGNAGGVWTGRRARFGSRGTVAAAVVPAVLLLAVTPGVEAAPSAPAQPRQAAAAAAPSRTWAQPTDVPGSVGGVGPLVTVGDRTAVAVWQSAVASGGGDVRAAQLASGVWGSSMLVPNSTGMGGLALAGDAQGRAIVGWRASVPTGGHFTSVVRAADFDGSTWVTTEQLLDLGSAQGAVALAMNPAGRRGVAVWQQWGTTGYYLRGSFFSFPEATWGDHEPLRKEATGETVRDMQDVAVGPDGTTVAVWASDDGSILAAWSKDGRTWTSESLLDGTEFAEGRRPQVAVDGRGHAVAVWNQYDWTSRSYSINAAEFDGTSWKGTQYILDKDLADVSSPQVAVNASGEAVVAWTAPPSEGQPRTVAVNRRVAGLWRGRESLASGDVSPPQVGIDDQGRALVLWGQGAGSAAQLKARAWEAGAWAATVTVSGSGASYPSLSVNRAGDAVAVWETQRSGTTVIQAARYVRAAPPGGTRFTVKLTVGAGQAPVGTRVRYTVRVTPVTEAAGRQVTMQVLQPNGTWASKAVVTLDGSGAYTAAVVGSSPGVSAMRAVLPRSGNSPKATSNTCRIRWLPR